jgi:hypothetical protein
LKRLDLVHPPCPSINAFGAISRRLPRRTPKHQIRKNPHETVKKT